MAYVNDYKMYVSLAPRLHGLNMQGPFPPAAVPQGGGWRGVVAQRAQPGLHRHFPDAQRAAALHAALRDAAAGLQRPPAGV